MTEKSSPTGGTDRRRAKRFPIETPVFYRIWNEGGWHYGTTENISTSGIFFRCDELPEFGKRVEMGFVLPSPLQEGSGAKVACSGEVVRLEAPREVGGLPALAVHIMYSQMFPWKHVPGEAGGVGGEPDNEG